MPFQFTSSTEDERLDDRPPWLFFILLVAFMVGLTSTEHGFPFWLTWMLGLAAIGHYIYFYRNGRRGQRDDT